MAGFDQENLYPDFLEFARNTPQWAADIYAAQQERARQQEERDRAQLEAINNPVWAQQPRPITIELITKTDTSLTIQATIETSPEKRNFDENMGREITGFIRGQLTENSPLKKDLDNLVDEHFGGLAVGAPEGETPVEGS